MKILNFESVLKVLECAFSTSHFSKDKYMK
jgi:hypothetical protein